MPFSPVPRGRFERTSLREVICQVRFAPVLKIEEDKPVEFQELLRPQGFVGYERREVTSLPLSVFGGRPVSVVPQRVEHVFLASGRRVSVVLASDFVAVSASDYPGWIRMKGWIDLVVGYVRKRYAPAHVGRVGLRYQNIIRRTALDLDPSTPWSELLCEPLLGVTSAATDVVAATQEIRFGASADRVQGRLAHGLVEDDGEQVYAIDTDHFVEGELSFDEAANALENLHDQAWYTFAWCAKERLTQAMRPLPPENR